MGKRPPPRKAPTVKRRTARDRARAEGQQLLEQLIPFPEWLLLAPRTLGDVDLYSALAEKLAYQATTGGKPPARAASRSMAVSEGLDDEASFFRFDAPASTAHT